METQTAKLGARPTPVVEDGPRAAEHMARALAGYGPTGPARARKLRTLQGVRNAVERQEPVLLTGQLPQGVPDADGYWPALKGDRRERGAAIVVSYSEARAAFRVLTANGLGWGQLGRAWIPRADLGRLMSHLTAVGYVPAEG